jgi:hypothetical protein
MAENEKIPASGMWAVTIIEAIRRGQLFTLGFLAIVGLVIFKMEDTTELVYRVVDRLVDLSLLGWAIAVIVAAGSGMMIYRQKNSFREELKRVIEERDRLLFGLDRPVKKDKPKRKE